jgi:DNA-binding CsgD family transcriptional regulator
MNMIPTSIEAAPKRRPTRHEIIKAVSIVTGIAVKDLIGPRRHAELARARMITYYVARSNGYSSPQVGYRIGRRDHSTVLSGECKIRRQLRAGNNMLAGTIGRVHDLLESTEIDLNRREGTIMTYHSRGIVRRDNTSKRLRQLTDKQKNIIEAWARRGKRDRETATYLQIDERQVTTYRVRLGIKGIGNRGSQQETGHVRALRPAHVRGTSGDVYDTEWTNSCDEAFCKAVMAAGGW